jgi:hypothetical protein
MATVGLEADVGWWSSIKAATTSGWQHLAGTVARYRRSLLIACGLLVLGILAFVAAYAGWLPVALDIAWMLLRIALPIALPIGLLVVLAIWLIRLFIRVRQHIWPAIRRHWISILIIIGIFVFFLVDLPYLIKDQPLLNSATGKYWLQTVAGNWAPPQDAPPPDTQNPVGQTPPPAGGGSSGPVTSPYWYAFSVILAILLNNALYLAIIGSGLNRYRGSS